MHTFTRIAIGTALACCLAGVAEAQEATSARLGSQLAYQFDVRDPGIAAQLDVPVARHFALYPSGAVYLVDEGSLWGVNADVKYRVSSPLYVGGGLNILHRSDQGADETDAGINFLGGIEGHLGRDVHPFAEGRVILNDGSAFQLGAGLSISLR